MSVTVTVKLKRKRAPKVPKAARVRARLTHEITTDTTVKYLVRGVYMSYRVWYADQWYWAAGGNGGTAPSQFMAEQLAKRWLRDGQ